MPAPSLVEGAVRETYARGAHERVNALCCPVDYDLRYLEAIPVEVIERDYGCGDPSAYVREGETVLDLGSGTGKICFIAAQVVGPTGRVIGVDMTPEMLEVARRNTPAVADVLGFDNVEFRRGRIQDLALDLDRFDAALKTRDLSGAEGWIEANETAEALRRSDPLVPDQSVDVVVSNCVLNLVAASEKPKLFREIHRVLRRGGRAVISDIVSDEAVPMALAQDEDLWAGCIAGALTEQGFLEAFEEAGFYGIQVLVREAEPWQVVEGIEFRSITVEAFRGKEGPCFERNQAVIYRGPFREVVDDDGHTMRRGERVAVCDKTFQIFGRTPYAEHFDQVEPRIAVAPEDAGPFDCERASLRGPRETKGEEFSETLAPTGDCCGPDACC